MLVYDSEMGLALIVMLVLGILLGILGTCLYNWGIRNGTEIAEITSEVPEWVNTDSPSTPIPTEKSSSTPTRTN